MEYVTEAAPRTTTPDNVPVFCSYDEIVPIKELKPNPKNPNQHNPQQIALLGDIIASTGWRAPITVSKRSGLIVKGHGRRQAAIIKRLKYVPVEYQDYASEAEEHADLLADNRIAELAQVDTALLMDMVQDMDSGEIPIELTGYTSEDLASILSAMEGADDTVDDGADAETDNESEKPPVSQPGDLWRLGKHRLLCGSATDAEAVSRLMDGELAQVVHTDPPYGVSYETQSGKFGMIMNDDATDDDLMAGLLVPAFRNAVKHSADDAAFYIWHASSTYRDFSDALMAAGLMEKEQIVWVKDSFVLGHADYHWAHEPCIYCEKAGQHCKYFGDRSQSTAWKVTIRDIAGLATSLHGGLVITDGAGHKLVLSEKPPKGKKMRYIRIGKDKPVFVFSGEPNTTAWEIARETGTVHPCLPAGQKVYFNGMWKDIETVQVGDTNRYGHVVAVSSHTANRLVEIQCDGDSVIATWNHPFLVQKDDGVYWIFAENIKKGDRVIDVCRKDKDSQQKDTFADAELTAGCGSSTTLSGENTTEKSLIKCKSTTRTGTRPTTTYPICSLSLPLSTSGFTKVASRLTGNGINLVSNAENIKNVPLRTGISPEAGLTEDCARNVTSERCALIESGVLRTVGSVHIIEKPTRVYNLTMSSVPAFDTRIGLSHNTQKPVEIPIRAISNSSEPGDVVLDLFGGSGSTLIAAEMTGRACRMTELDPKYVDAIVRRYVEQTGDKNVVCERDGKEYGYEDLFAEKSAAEPLP